MPKGDLIYAVGDIHGCSDLLAALLVQIEADAAKRQARRKRLIFLGDYVDRGPDSRGVIDILLHELPAGFAPQFLKGNHEALLLAFLANAENLEHWRINGGEETMASYGVDVDQLKRTLAAPETWQEAFSSALPKEHLDFLRSLDLKVSATRHLFVHAGIRPGVPLNAQKETDLTWIRDEFLDATKPFGKVVVHGHTPEDEPVVRPNRIGIDTGAVFTGKLTALRLQSGEQSFLST